jgi:hypothetical protein
MKAQEQLFLDDFGHFFRIVEYVKHHLIGDTHAFHRKVSFQPLSSKKMSEDRTVYFLMQKPYYSR